MRFIILFVIVVITLTGCSEKKLSERILIAVKRDYRPIPKDTEDAQIIINWNELSSRIKSIKTLEFSIMDQNFGKPVEFKVCDIDNNGAPDFLVLQASFQSNEPIYSYEVITNNGVAKVSIEKEVVTADSRFKVSFLQPVMEYIETNGKIKFSQQLVESTLSIYPDPMDFPIYNPGKWNYEYGFFLSGAYLVGKANGRTQYVSYTKKWVDSFIDSTGVGFKEGVYDMSEYKLDDVIPGRLALFFYEDTNDPKYKSIADTLRKQLHLQPKTSDGGYWHKQVYPNQMWLDGIFMGDVFAMQYARVFNEPELVEESVHQIELIFEHTYDSLTGLMYHGWDESKNPIWADPIKGTSPSFWGRAIGWYEMALVQCLDYLPEDHPKRDNLISILKTVSEGVLKYQDQRSDLWYQVMDKGENPENWIETSCSAMFAYAFAKGYHQGFLDEKFYKSAEKAFDALLRDYVFIDDNRNLHLTRTVKVGTLNFKSSKGDFDYYVTTECRLDDYKGLASLLYASMELNK